MPGNVKSVTGLPDGITVCPLDTDVAREFLQARGFPLSVDSRPGPPEGGRAGPGPLGEGGSGKERELR
jgi:hypothetical protein